MITFTPVDGKGSVVGCNIENGKYLANGVTPGKNFVNVAAVKEVTFSRVLKRWKRWPPVARAKVPLRD